MEHKYQHEHLPTLAGPYGCSVDCPACAVEKYRKDVLEKIKAKRDKVPFSTYFYFYNQAKIEVLDELIKELEAEKW